jgi:hypothetical protein
MLVLPGVPTIAEHKFMEGFVKTYGKVFHFWQVDRGDELPLGPPRLMMALTADGTPPPPSSSSSPPSWWSSHTLAYTTQQSNWTRTC